VKSELENAMDDERRKLERKFLVVYSRVFDRRSGKVIGYLSDLTVKGAMVIGEHHLEQGDSYQLRIDLPESNEFKKDHLDITAKSVWSRPDIDPVFFNTGFEFDELNPGDEKIIERMIELYEFRRETGKYPPSVSELQDRNRI
jgi:hypothetical protein